MLEEIHMPEITRGNLGSFCYSAVTELSFPKLRYAGEECFAYCGSLIRIDVPELEELGKSALYACNTLEYFDAEKLKTVGDLAFKVCRKLSQVTLPAANVSLSAMPCAPSPFLRAKPQATKCSTNSPNWNR